MGHGLFLDPGRNVAGGPFSLFFFFFLFLLWFLFERLRK
jgi:hypothetical protein